MIAYCISDLDYPNHRVVKCEITKHSYVTYMVKPVSMATLLSSMLAVPHGQRQLWPFGNSSGVGPVH